MTKLLVATFKTNCDSYSNRFSEFQQFSKIFGIPFTYPNISTKEKA